MKAILITTLVLSINASALLAQPDTLWSRVMGGDSHETFRRTYQTTDNGIVTIGYTASYGAGGYDVWVVKMNDQGEELWSHTYGTPVNDLGKDIIESANGNLILVSQTQVRGVSDVWIMGVDSLGNEQWDVTYGESFHSDSPVRIIKTMDDNFVVVGYGGSGIFLHKFDENGSHIWSKSYPLENNENINDAVELSNGDLMLVGSIYLNSTNMGLIIKADSFGDTLWSKQYMHNDTSAYFRAISKNPLNNTLILGGQTTSPSFPWISSVNENGDVLWKRAYTTGEEGQIYSIFVTQDGDVLAGGTNYPLMMKTDHDGNKLWVYQDGGDALSTNWCFDVKEIGGGGVIACGNISSIPTGNDAWIERFKPIPNNGPVWHVATNGSAFNSGASISPLASIQAAIDSASNGDTVLVQPGTYVENINFNGKNIVVGSLFLTTQDTSYISQTIIDGNQSGSVVTINGGETSAKLVGIKIINGSAAYGGGIVMGANACCIIGNSSSYASLENLIISNNYANNDGGGIWWITSNNFKATIKNCEIISNSANRGAGLYFQSAGDIDINNCTFQSNFGQGIYTSFTNLNIYNSTIVDNSGPGIHRYGTSTHYLRNSIIWNNGNQISFSASGVPGDVDIAFCLIEDGAGGIETNNLGSLIWGVGNIDADPQFVNPAISDYNLSDYSPAIGFGTTIGSPLTDINGDLRPNPAGSNPDLGAYENPYGIPQHMPITINIPGDYSSIQSGLNAADSTDTVLVQPGTYYENIFWPETNGIHLAGSSTASNVIINGGGNASVITINPTQTVIDTSTNLSKITLTNGGGVTSGGGLLISGASPILEELIIEGNHANVLGGGICVQYDSDLKFRSSIIRNNSSGDQGGGLLLYRSSPVLTDLEIYENTARDGAGIYLVECVNPHIENLFIRNNIASDEGGGAYFSQNSTVDFKNSIFYNNSAAWGGGGLYLYNQSDTTARHISFIENHSDHEGGAIQLRFGNPVLTGVTITRNTENEGNEGIFIQNGAINVSESNLHDNGTAIYDYDNTANSAAINNWWGDSTGPYHPTQNTNGTGDSTNIFVNVVPFLTEQSTTAPPIRVENVEITDSGNNFLSLQWGAHQVTDLSGYKLYYDSDEPGFPYTNNIDLEMITSTTLSGLLSATTYFLAIVAYDTDGNESWYSEEVEGTTRVMEAQNLDIAGGEDIEHIIDHSPTISYEYFDSMGEAQTHYHLQVSTHSDFNTLDMWDSGSMNDNATAVQYLGFPLLDGTTYFMRIKVASNDFWSDWQTLSFRMNTNPPVPVLISPINNQVSGSPVLLKVLNVIDAETDPISYSFHVYADVSLTIQLDSAINISEGADTTDWQITAALADNGQYFWTTSSNDGYEESALSDAGTFLLNISNDKPGAYSLVSPTNNSQVTTQKPRLIWESSFDPDPIDTVSYVLYLDTPDPGVETFDVGTDTSYQIISDLSDNTTYNWRVIASDLNGASTENTSGYQSFRINTSNDVPTAFNLLAPVADMMVTSLTPEFLWEVSSDPDDVALASRGVVQKKLETTTSDDRNTITAITGYDFYLSTDIDLTDAVAVDVIGTSYIPGEALLENQVYYWAVSAVDDSGGVTFSDTTSFWTNAENEPPTQFVLLTPSHEAEVGILPTFSWTQSSDADLFEEIHYLLKYGPDVFSLTSVDSDSQTVFTPSEPLEENASYVWQVICSDAQGMQYETEFSSFYVNSENDAPSSFALISPDSSAWLTENDLMLVWEPSSDLEGSEISYSVSLSMDSENIQPIDTVFSNYYTLYGLLEGYYFWQIEASDELGGSSVSPVWSFLVNAENDAPNAFNTHEPTDGQLLTTQNVTFTWEPSSSGDAGDQTSYILELGTSTDDILSVYEGSDTLYAYPELLGDNESYSWRVIAKDLAGATTVNEGGYQSFTINTSNDLPAAFELLSPVANMMVTSLTPEFLWEASSDPDDVTITSRSVVKQKLETTSSSDRNTITAITGYQFYLGTGVGLTDVVPVEVIGTSYIPSEDLIENQVYYWTVSAVDDSGSVTFSDTASFWTNSINSAPSMLTLLTPTSDSETGLTPTFSWTASENEDLQDEISYTLKYGPDVFGLISVNTEMSTVFTPGELLSDNTEYIWQVVAEDLSGATYSTGFSSFYVNSENDVPGEFNLVGPDSASWITNADVMLVWEPSSDAESGALEYVVFMRIDAGSLESVDTVSVNYYALHNLEDDYYFWQIEAIDDLGESQLSSVWTFLINANNDVPDPFVLYTPLDATVLTMQLPEFTWQPSSPGDVGDQTSYRLILGTSVEDVALIYEGPDTSFTVSEPLTDNMTHYCQVEAIDLAGAITVNEGGYQSFTINTVNDAPSMATLTSPDSVVVLTDMPTFSWTASTDIDPFDAVSYEVHWWFDGGEWDSVLTDETTVTAVNPLTQDNLEYHWEVISMDTQDALTHSETKSFWVDFMPEVPGLFTLTGPDSASAGNGTRPELSWTESIDPDPFDNVYYRVAIATDSLLENVVLENVALIETLIPESDLENDTRYYWQVTAIDEDSLITRSDVWTFDVGYLAVDEYAMVPDEFTLQQNFPNPFNPSTIIRYGLPEDSNVSLVIYDLRGNVVHTLESGAKSAGWYEQVWNGETADGKTISTGIYFARIVAGDYSQVIKMLYLK